MIAKIKFSIFNNIVAHLIVIAFFFIGCSNDENGTNSINENGGNVFRYQVVTIDVPNLELDENQYNATFGSFNVTIIKADEHKLVFSIPIEAPLGNTELIIPDLNNSKITYNVLEPQLTQSAEETFSSFMSLADTHFLGIQNPSIEESNALNTFEQFKDYYVTLSLQEKEKLALFYQVNKQAIDNVILFDGSNQGNRFTQEDVVIISKFCLAAVATVGGGISVLYGGVTLKLIGVVIAQIGHSNAIKYHKQLQDRSIKVIYLSASGILGQNGKSIQSNQILLVDNEVTTIPLQLVERPLIQNDQNNSNIDILRFFSGQSSYNNFVENVNTAIQWVNSNSWISIDTIALATLSSNPTLTNADVTSESISNITFSISHPNLQLVSTSLSSEGQLNLKVKIIGNPADTPVNSTLNYSYSDDLNNIQGAFPISVVEDTSAFLVGTWNLVSYNGYNANQNYDLAICQSSNDTYAGFTVYGTAVFTLTTFDCTVGRSQYYRDCATNQCTTSVLCFDNPNLYAHVGTYQSEGNYQYTVLTNTGDTLNTTISVIDQNNILVTQGSIQKRYTRQ